MSYRSKKKSENMMNSHLNSITEDERKLCGISITYLERILRGHHPVNNSIIENDTILVDDNVQRCFSFIVEILKKVSSKDVVFSELTLRKPVQGRKSKSPVFRDGAEIVIDRMIQEKEISVSELEALIKLYDIELFEEEIEKISVARISNWLLDKGYLVRIVEEDGNYHREATEDGKAIGMTNNVIQSGDKKSYIQYKFNPKAQRFILENLPEIVAYKKKKS